MSLDEMMIHFFGRSIKIHQMKYKPVKEDYSLFVLTTKDGYIVNFTPDGRTATSTGTQEYVSKGVGSKIESMVMFVVSVIAYVKKKQTS